MSMNHEYLSLLLLQRKQHNTYFNHSAIPLTIFCTDIVQPENILRLNENAACNKRLVVSTTTLVYYFARGSVS